MKKIVLLLLLALPAVAQSDLCWRDPYPRIPGEWVGSGSVIEGGNRFQSVTGATVELWATTYKYDHARQNAIRHQILPATLVETAVSDLNGAFIFKTLQQNKKTQPGYFEIRVRMPGREGGSAWRRTSPGIDHSGEVARSSPKRHTVCSSQGKTAGKTTAECAQQQRGRNRTNKQNRLPGI